MITPGIARRFTAALHLLWFALYVGVPQLVHPCPEHMAAGVEVEAPEQTGPSGGHAHHGKPSPSQDARGEECCCPGPQCGVAAMVAGTDRAVSPGVVRPGKAAPHFARLGASRGRIPHALPLATAPPSPSA